MKYCKLAAGVCAGMMVLASMPMAPVTEIAVCAEEKAPTSGTFGTDSHVEFENGNVFYFSREYQWNFDKATGTLTITGEGECPDLPQDDKPWTFMEDLYKADIPWAPYWDSITSLVLSEGIETIGQNVFYNCHNLESVTFPETLTEIGLGAFQNCSSLKEVSFPKHVKTIGEGAFHNCTGLTSITFQDELETINTSAFMKCENLTSITFQEGLETIKDSAFADCNSLTTVQIPDSVTTLCGFTRCENLKNFNCPKNLKTILVGGSKVLTKLDFPEGVKSISVLSCPELTEIRFPDSVERVSVTGCDALKTLSLPDNVKYLKCQSNKGLTDIKIPAQLTSFESTTFGAPFMFCESLTSITIPETIGYLPNGSFTCCNALKELIILNPSCGIGTLFSKDFYGSEFTGTIYGYEGSTAQAYAEEHHYPFVALTSPPPTEPAETTEPTTETTEPTTETTEPSTETTTVTDPTEPTDSTEPALVAVPAEPDAPVVTVPTDPTEPAESAFLLGDVNLSGTVDASDAADLLIDLAKVGAGEVTGLDETQQKAADADGNTGIDAADATAILQYAAFIGAGGSGTMQEFLAS